VATWTSFATTSTVAADGTTVLEQITGIDPAITGENGHLFSDPTIGMLKGDDTLTGAAFCRRGGFFLAARGEFRCNGDCSEHIADIADRFRASRTIYC
jgi:hypothetical protein